MKAAATMTNADWLGPTGDGFYFCNNTEFQGYPIDSQCVAQWKKAREGLFGDGCTKQNEFFKAGTSLCTLRLKKGCLTVRHIGNAAV